MYNGNNFKYLNMAILSYGQVGWRSAVVAPLISVTPLLDTYTGAAAAYSLRKLRTAYTGYAICVRRSSDNTSQDIGFRADGTLDTTALTSFVGVNSGYVSIWYDQSGNSKNAAQLTWAYQPLIVYNGTLQTNNGKPSLFFDGSNKFLDCGYLNGGTKPANYSTFIPTTFTSQGQTQSIFGSLNNTGQGLSGYNTLGVHSAISYKMFAGSGDGTNYRYWNTANTPSVNTSYLFESHYKSNTSPYLGKIYWNNSLQSVSDWGGGTAQQSGGTELKTSIGRAGEYVGDHFNGYLQEIVTYFSDQTANRAPIASNINSFYTIY